MSVEGLYTELLYAIVLTSFPNFLSFAIHTFFIKQWTLWNSGKALQLNGWVEQGNGWPQLVPQSAPQIQVSDCIV